MVCKTWYIFYIPISSFSILFQVGPASLYIKREYFISSVQLQAFRDTVYYQQEWESTQKC